MKTENKGVKIMRIINLKFNALYESPTLEWNKTERIYEDYAPSYHKFLPEDGWVREQMWHLSSDLLPKPMNASTPCSNDVAIELEDGFNDIAYYDHEERGWFKDYDDPITEVVVAWCELPKRRKD